jgi:hypothetical protein
MSLIMNPAAAPLTFMSARGDRRTRCGSEGKHIAVEIGNVSHSSKEKGPGTIQP